MLKSRPCRNYLNNECKYGDNCMFAHDNEKFSKFKTKKCKNFWQKGVCTYGLRCQFIHKEFLISKLPRTYTSLLKRIK